MRLNRDVVIANLNVVKLHYQCLWIFLKHLILSILIFYRKTTQTTFLENFFVPYPGLFIKSNLCSINIKKGLSRLPNWSTDNNFVFIVVKTKFMLLTTAQSLP